MTPSPEVPLLHYTEWGNVGEGRVLAKTWEGLFTPQRCSPGRMELCSSAGRLSWLLGCEG